MRTHTMTPARRAALKKAQLASARKRKGKRPKNDVNAGLRAAAVVGTYLAVRNGTAVGVYAATGQRAINTARLAGVAAGVGAGVAVNRKINNINTKRQLARKTVAHGRAAQKGRRIKR